MLKVTDLTYLHTHGKGVSNINFELNKGSHLALIGESGCGKSTLIQSLYGIYDLEQGSIYWEGDKVLGPAYNLVPGFKSFKHLSQEFDLMPFTSAEENIQKFLSRETLKKNKKRSDELCSLFDLEDVKHQKVKSLSGGQKQRVALAQALAKPPELILLDEPFSHIDQFLKHKLRRKLFKFLKKENITCIYATHDSDDVLPFSDFTLVLKAGKILDYRPTSQVYNRPKNEYCASLFGDINVLNSKEFKINTEDQNIVIYPNEIVISDNAKYPAEVTSCYFKGSYYLLELKYDNQLIFATSEKKYKTGKEVFFKIDADKVQHRLN